MVMGGEWTTKTITLTLALRGDLTTCAFFLTCDPNSVASRLSLGGDTEHRSEKALGWLFQVFDNSVWRSDFIGMKGGGPTCSLSQGLLPSSAGLSPVASFGITSDFVYHLGRSWTWGDPHQWQDQYFLVEQTESGRGKRKTGPWSFWPIFLK